ncbi:MAG: hypothetical protein JWM35_1352, partial [Verrucomicrobia bacterium]|nr:hypothetical protein [Verrucomicrobiota bacterium]
MPTPPWNVGAQSCCARSAQLVTNCGLTEGRSPFDRLRVFDKSAPLHSIAICAVVVALFAASPAHASEGRNDTPLARDVVASLPHFQPGAPVSGTIRLWGHGRFSRPFMRLLVARWVKGFKRFQPGVTIVEETYGTSSAIPALALGVGDLAILGEEILPEAVDTFERIKPYPPFGVDIATGSVDVRNFDYAQMFFVHKDNPLAQLTLTQL